MRFSLSQIAEVLGSPLRSEVQATGFSVDSRTLQAGDLFFALSGPNHSGNDYVQEVLDKRAAGVVATRSFPGPVILVPDALLALQKLASWAREKWGGDVIGVTGSAGKTSTKDITAALLGSALQVGKTEGNFNNHVGLPLSILRLPEEVEAAVLEMGMNHEGEIRTLAGIAKPKIGVVTTVGYAHMEYFHSIEEVAAAKHELIEALPASGTAVLNADDPLVHAFSFAGRKVTYGVDNYADIRAQDVELLSSGAHFRVDDVHFETTLLGRHGVRNILAGIAVAGLYGIMPSELREAVASLRPGKMRGERFTHQGILIFDDCYNSNPEAARSMIDVLRDTPARRRIAVLGEMLELGRWSESLHSDLGRYVAQTGISVLVGIHGAARYMVDSAAKAGLPAEAAFFFDDPKAAGQQLKRIAREGDLMLFKGSRGTHLELALESFLGSD
jgi:UDP-N-acetylmuramoyl-tripeptide--D-alanyl-D-alanine ligase